MMTSRGRTGALAALSILMLLVFIGCDEPNEPDLPYQQYRFVTSYPMEGTPEDVCVRDGWAAISNGTFGAKVLDVRNPSAITVKFTYTASAGARCANVTLDVLHHYLIVFCYPGDPDNYNTFDFTKPTQAEAALPPTISFTGPLGGFDVDVREHAEGADTLVIWGTDLTSSDRFLSAAVRRRADDTATWVTAPGCANYIPSHGQPRGMDLRSDGFIAVANDDAGIFIYNSRQCRMEGEVNTPGIAHDCAWMGDYIVVADDYRVTVVNATDPTAPVVTSSLVVNGASRLRKIAVIDPYVALLDEYDGIYIVDVWNRAEPVQLQLLPLEDPTAVSAWQGRLFVTDRALGLVIYEPAPMDN